MTAALVIKTSIYDFHFLHKVICFPHKILSKYCFYISLGTNNHSLGNWRQNLHKKFAGKNTLSGTLKSQITVTFTVDILNMDLG